MELNDYILTNTDGTTSVDTEKIDDNLEECKKKGDFSAFFELLRCFEQSKPEFLKDVYRFCLKSIIPNETSPLYFERLRLKWQTEILETNTEDSVKAVHWLRVCVNTEDEHIRFYFAVSKRDREKEVKDVIFEKGGSQLKSFYLDKAELYAVPLLDWFLKRYDLVTASQIISQIENNVLSWLFKLIYRTKLFLIGALSFVFVVMLLILIIKPQINWVISANKFLNDFPIFKNPDIKYFNQNMVMYNNLISPILMLIYLALLVFIPFFTFLRSVMWLKLMVPRLVAAIILGLFVLWATDEIWRYSISINPLAAIIIFLFSNLIAYLYLKIEINNAKVAPSNIKIRAAIIWLLGILESLIIALVVSDFASQYFIPIENHRPLCGVFGIIYPQVVFIYSALALLIGIFVQIIWEEKPITHPL